MWGIFFIYIYEGVHGLDSKYNKNSLINEISQETGIKTSDVKKVVNLFVKKIIFALLGNGKVLITGLGTFGLRAAKPRRVNNLKNEGNIISIEERYIPKLKFSPGLVKKIRAVK